MNHQLEARASDKILPSEKKPPRSDQAKPNKRNRVTGKQDDRNARLQKELVGRLRRLRNTTKDITRIYLSKVESDIISQIESVESGGGRKKKRWKNGLLEKVNDALDDLNIKPEKGRRKDLKRIELVLSSISSLLSRKK